MAVLDQCKAGGVRQAITSPVMTAGVPSKR